MAIPELIPNIVGGQEIYERDLPSIDVLSPHDRSIICRAPCSSAETVDKAVKAAAAAQAGWAATPAVERGRILHHICNAFEANSEEIAAIVAQEAGKRMPDALGECAGAVQCGRFFAGEGQRLFGRTMTSGVADKYAMTVRQPCGVAALIIAANTPAPNFAWKVFPALICGNAVVLKTAEDTPISSWFLAKLAHEAGLPDGVLNVVHGIGAEAGDALVVHPDVQVISFTGSTKVGRRIGGIAGEQLKKVSLELGGKNPLVVCDDADIDNAVHWAVLSAFSNAGQRCASGSRILVAERVYDDFVTRFVEKTSALKLGIDDDCDVGPVISERQLANMLLQIENAKRQGEKVLIGGVRSERSGSDRGFYLEPTILESAQPDSELSTTELFGPIASVFRVKDFHEALKMANTSPYGLTASIHTSNFDRAMEFSYKVQAGATVVNAGTFGSEPHMPFGGLKSSGNGTREPGTEALDVYSELKDIYLNINRQQC